MENSGSDTVKICYVLGMIGVFVPLCMVAGAIVAYISRPRTDSWIVETHFDNFIKYFWVWVVLCIATILFVIVGGIFFTVLVVSHLHQVGIFLFLVLLPLMYLALGIFFIVKFCVGFSALTHGEPIE